MTYNWTIFLNANPDTKEGLTVGTLRSGDLDDFLADIKQFAWSPFVFKNNYRLGSNWLSCDFLVADYDSGIPTLATAIAKVQPLKHIVGTTKSHQKVKDGKPAVDRFRVILPLDASLTAPADYRNLWNRFALFLPRIDTQCKDLARFYWPIRELSSADFLAPSIQLQNLPKPQNWVKVGKPTLSTMLRTIHQGSAPPAPNTSKGVLTRRTETFLSQGALPNQWHDEFRFAAKDLKAQNYSYVEAEDFLKKITGKLDSEDKYQLRYAYEKDPYPFKFRPLTTDSKNQEGT